MSGIKGKSGRRPESKLRRFHELIDNCWSTEMREAVLMELVRDCSSVVFQERHESRKLLFAYTFGKPKESVEHSNPDGSSLFNSIDSEALKSLKQIALRLTKQELSDEQGAQLLVESFKRAGIMENPSGSVS